MRTLQTGNLIRFTRNNLDKEHVVEDQPKDIIANIEKPVKSALHNVDMLKEMLGKNILFPYDC